MSGQIPERPLKAPLRLLASELDKAENNPQSNSQFCQLLHWYRERIYEYVFTAEDIPYTPHRPGGISYDHQRIHTSLLLTCRAIYTEACLLPISLNPAYGASSHLTPKIPAGMISLHTSTPHHPAAWQFAALSSLLLHTDQKSLESTGTDLGIIANYAKSHILAPQRHDGLFVAAKGEKDDAPHSISLFSEHFKDSFSYAIEDPQDRYQTRLWKDKQGFRDSASFNRTYSSLFVRYEDDCEKPFTKAAEIKDLTVCVELQDLSADDEERRGELALDPGFSFTANKEMKMGIDRMIQAARDRRACRDRGEPEVPLPEHSWGREVALFPDLHRFTLYLEASTRDKDALDRVVECAKLWEFPRESQKRVLGWYGDSILAYRRGEKQCSDDNDDGKGDSSSGWSSSGVEVRVISFTRSPFIW